MHDNYAALASEHNLAESILIERGEPAKSITPTLPMASAASSAGASAVPQVTMAAAVPGLSDNRFSDRLDRAGGVDRAGGLIQSSGFKQNARVGRSHGGAQDIVSVLGRGRQSDSQSRDMCEQGFKALRMLGAGAGRCALLCANDKRNGERPAVT